MSELKLRPPKDKASGEIREVRQRRSLLQGRFASRAEAQADSDMMSESLARIRSGQAEAPTPREGT